MPDQLSILASLCGKNDVRDFLWLLLVEAVVIVGGAAFLNSVWA